MFHVKHFYAIKLYELLSFCHSTYQYKWITRCTYKIYISTCNAAKIHYWFIASVLLMHVLQKYKLCCLNLITDSTKRYAFLFLLFLTRTDTAQKYIPLSSAIAQSVQAPLKNINCFPSVIVQSVQTLLKYVNYFPSAIAQSVQAPLKNINCFPSAAVTMTQFSTDI